MFKETISPSPLMGEGRVRVNFLFRTFEFVSCFGFRASNLRFFLYQPLPTQHFNWVGDMVPEPLLRIFMAQSQSH